ncbi:uncharacterized protein [Salmo salar]|uniref:Uncharacterized protein n=1 Tax=Salmo salar TaxID=8030 RepID=A0ABM3DX14_SALSA|nr:uncharacterized protein LOC106586714 [Salmo salar]
MLCESRLWSMTYCSEQDRLDPLPPVIEPPRRSVKAGSELAAATLLQASPGQPSRNGQSILSRVPQNQRPSQASAQIQPQAFSPPQDLHSQSPHPDRHISPEMEIPGQACSGGEVPFLVPSFCQSICQNYSDLHIGGDQVLPLLAHDGEVLPCSDNQANGPFLHSCDVPPAAEDSPPDRATEDGLLRPLQWGSGLGSSRWRAGSGRDRSVLLQGLEGPLSNSLLNRYLENKILDLYQQYMLENMAHDGGYVEGLPCSLLASELILTSLDQITLQLSREGHLEAGRAKDMVLSCLLRVASGLQSSEISTPLLQISTDLQLPTDTATGAAASGATASGATATSTATGAAASGVTARSTASGATASGATARSTATGAAASGATASGATARSTATGAAASGATATSTSTVAAASGATARSTATGAAASGATASGATARSTATGAAASGATVRSTATGAAASGATVRSTATGAAASGATVRSTATGAADSGATATSTSTVAIIADAAKPQGPLSSTIDPQVKNIL